MRYGTKIKPIFIVLYWLSITTSVRYIVVSSASRYWSWRVIGSSKRLPWQPAVRTAGCHSNLRVLCSLLRVLYGKGKEWQTTGQENKKRWREKLMERKIVDEHSKVIVASINCSRIRKFKQEGILFLVFRVFTDLVILFSSSSLPAVWYCRALIRHV